MNKKEVECLICGGKIVYNNLKKEYRCHECNAIISPSVFSEISKQQKKPKFSFPLLKIIFGILGAAYLFYFLMRIFIY